MKFYKLFLTSILIAIFLFSINCESPTGSDMPSRESKIPDDAVKVTPDTDSFPPVMNSNDWKSPVPLSGPVNTAGIEDSPFITPDGKSFYFFFTPDADAPPQNQIQDSVTGIWWSEKVNDSWAEPERIILDSYESLDGAVFVLKEMMWFGSVRSGNYGEVDIYISEFEDGEWQNVRNAGIEINQDYNVGELHINQDTSTMYYDRGDTDKDLWKLINTQEGWIAPMEVEGINTDKNEAQPFLTDNGDELWFTGESNSGYPGPAIFRSVKNDSGWNEPEEIISNFSGEPCLDSAGNIYFVHLFYDADMKKIEADIYFAEKK